jgi:hypothetical protein
MAEGDIFVHVTSGDANILDVERQRHAERSAAETAQQEAAKARRIATDAVRQPSLRRHPLPSEAELLALDVHAEFRIIVGGPERSHKTGTEEAYCEWNGRRFEVRSRHGAAYDLCRQLVAAGIPDQPMQVYRASNGAHQYTFRSVHRAALWTIEESDSVPIRVIRYRPRPAGAWKARREAHRDGPTRMAAPALVSERDAGG